MKKFIIIAHTASHYYRVAEFFSKKNLLDKIISIYPKIKLDNYNLPKNKTKFLFLPFVIFCLRRFLKFKIPNLFYSKIFNFSCRSYINKKENNILIGSSGYCLNSINLAKKRNITTIVDRACPHINVQKRLIFNELDKLPIINPKKIKAEYFDNRIVDQMLIEYEKCDYISVPSKYSYNSFKKYNLEKKLILNQITPEKILHIQSFQNEEKSQFKIFSIGFSFIRKGFYYLIEAMDLLKNENIKLDLRTNIPDFLDIKQLPSNINIIKKHLTNKELQDYYNKADLIILPSVDEGFGMVGLEAMCLKKPVLVTENVGMKDIIKKYIKNSENYIINPANINELSKKIFELSKNRTKLRHDGELFFEATKKYLEKDLFKGYTNL